MIPVTLIDSLRTCEHIVVLTGSGTSAESGVPTFREAQTGLWSQYRPEELATPEAFARNPAVVWDWYQWRRNVIADVAPNAGHYAIAALEQLFPKFTLITQNVDGLHQRAGSEAVIEFHGNINRSRCTSENIVIEPHPDDDASPPACPNCGGPLRPDVVWFGEPIPTTALSAANSAIKRCDAIFVIGTSAQVQPAANLPVKARARGAQVIEINTDATPLSESAHFVLQGPSGRVLPELLEALTHAAQTAGGN
jgi:NAD-dependent deacetylase